MPGLRRDRLFNGRSDIPQRKGILQLLEDMGALQARVATDTTAFEKALL